MKQFIIVLLGIFLIYSVQAQSTIENVPVKKETATSQPVVAKGYYSIHNNAGKLKTGTTMSTIPAGNTASAVFSPAKGYYATGQNHRTIYGSGKSFIAVTPKRPAASKGYYNIEKKLWNEAQPMPDYNSSAVNKRDTLLSVPEQN